MMDAVIWHHTQGKMDPWLNAPPVKLLINPNKSLVPLLAAACSRAAALTPGSTTKEPIL